MFETSGLSVSFGGLRALDDVSLSVSTAEVVGLIGPNGSGKSTLINAVTGVVPSRGSIRVEGEPLRPAVRGALRRAGLARTFQTPHLVDELTCMENLLVALPDRRWSGLGGAWLNRPAMWRVERDRWRTAMELLERVGLADVAHGPAGDLPYGRQRFLEFARALAFRPRLIFLDECAAGLNHEESQGLAELVESVAAEGVSFLIVEHKLEFVRRLCTRVLALELGKLICEGPADMVFKDPRVIDAYLGAPDA